MKSFNALMIFAVLLLTADVVNTSAQPKSGREKIGIKLGYVDSNGNIDTNFGDGSAITVHFTERIKPPLFVGISIGALYLGHANVDSVEGHTEPVYIGDANMRILFISVSPTLEFEVTNSSIFYVTGGFGLYSINVLLDRTFFGFDTSQEHFGAGAAAGLYYSVSDNWKLNFNFTTHYMWTDEKGTDMFFFYSDGDSDPTFREFSIGVSYSMN